MSALFVPEHEGISPSQLLALSSLLAGDTVAASARAADVSRTTIYAWLEDPRFAAELRVGKERLRAQVDRRLDALGDRATGRLAELLESDNEQVALRASLAVLDRLDGHDPDTEPDAGLRDAQVAMVAEVVRSILVDLRVMDQPATPEIVHRHMLRLTPGASAESELQESNRTDQEEAS